MSPISMAPGSSVSYLARSGHDVEDSLTDSGSGSNVEHAVQLVFLNGGEVVSAVEDAEHHVVVEVETVLLHLLSAGTRSAGGRHHIEGQCATDIIVGEDVCWRGER